MDNPYNMPRYFHPNNICRGIKVIKLVMQKLSLIKFPSTSYITNGHWDSNWDVKPTNDLYLVPILSF